MKVKSFPKKYQRKRSARKRRTQYQSYFSSSSSFSGIHGYSKGFAGEKSQDQDNVGYNIVKYHHLAVTVIHVLVVPGKSKLLNPNSQFSCFPRGPRSKPKTACSKQMEMNNHIAAEGNFNKCPPSARRKGHKRKTKPKDGEQSDSEVTVPRRIHFRGRAKRGQNNTSTTITNERGKLDSATFLHYFTHIWSAFPEEKLHAIGPTRLEPLVRRYYQ